MDYDTIRTLSPLPSVVHAGSIAISVFALGSFFSVSGLLLYLIYKLVTWRLGRWAPRNSRRNAPGHMFASGSIKFGPAHDAARLAGSAPTVDAQSLVPSDRPQGPRYPNQFMVLFLNLLMADLHQAIAFTLNLSWVVRDSIDVETRTCFAQGLFVSIGDLASSLFMSAIAIHTFYSIVYKYRPPHKNLYYYILFIWTFVYLITLLPVAGTLNGAADGGFYVRAGAWYRRGSIGTTKNKDYHHPVFLIYPVIYLLCILPLAIGRVSTMAGSEPSLGYFCAAGALVASNGWLDVLLFTTTRRSIVFAHADELGDEDTGVGTFAFLKPQTFGNTVWVRGGDEESRKQPTGGWWRILGDPETHVRHPSHGGKSDSQISLETPIERSGIQMEVITTVVVEDRMPRKPEPSKTQDFQPHSMWPHG
ncbi:hypothetical protein NPX13_g2323 [Xylaria arbuscula]|uniref:G protein-coupled receptor GPR1/2/3 C-terminal domain-containing protein n=1 Tax=Xylaria arbuscula TaxID=114810 RepID=A0A9W8TQJ2_9PEZI|nr:hypothetical protein NPX13_g2323 [Xylaria arbuscula]